MNTTGKKILLVLSESRISQTEKLSGIFRYVNEHHVPWELSFANYHRTFTRAAVQQAIANRIDGVILSRPGTEACAPIFLAAGIPVVQIEQNPVIHEKVCAIQNDEEQIGIEAARECLKFSDRISYVFIGSHGSWSKLRRKGFQNELRKHGHDAAIYERRTDTTLAAWLAALTKPGIIFTADDLRAYDVLSVARACSLKIPNDLALLTVSSNRILCDNANPSLSCIQPDYERMGYEAACALDDLLAGHSVKTSVFTIPPKSIVLRASTPHSRPGMAIVARALEFMHDNITRHLSADDIARNLGISKRLLFLRFREVRGESVLQALTRLRLEETRARLLANDDTITGICRRCGWKSVGTAQALFRKRYGKTMRQYRTLARTLRV